MDELIELKIINANGDNASNVKVIIYGKDAAESGDSTFMEEPSANTISEITENDRVKYYFGYIR